MNRLRWMAWIGLAAAVLGLSGCAQRLPETPAWLPLNPRLTAPPATATGTARSLPPTNTPRPTRTPVPTPDLFTCPPVEPAQPAALEPLRLLYVNQDEVWLWDEASGGQSRVELPDYAAAPYLSPDGRYVAFFTQGQTHSRPAAALDAIPLGLLDRRTGSLRPLGSFSTVQARRQYPESQRITLQIDWLRPAGDPQQALELVVAVAAEPWDIDLSVTNGYISQRYRVDLETAEAVALSQSEYQRRYFPARSDGSGIARSVSPDERFEVLDSSDGVVVVDRSRGVQTRVVLPPACPDVDVCYLTGIRWIRWLPDSSAFFTSAAKAVHFDARAETTLYRVHVLPQVGVEAESLIRASPATFLFSPDVRYLAYWNQPDIDNAPVNTYNWVTLWLLHLEELQPRQYTSAWLLRLAAWNPDGQRFLLTFSPHGGANPVMTRLAVGSVCQPPVELAVAADQTILRATWLDAGRFLLWTAPTSGIPNRYESGLYFYNLNAGGVPLRIAGVIQDYDRPYGTRQEVVVLPPEA